MKQKTRGRAKTKAETGRVTLQLNTRVSGLKQRGYKYVRANLMAKGRANSQLAPLINCPRPRASRPKMSLVNPFSKPVNLLSLSLSLSLS